MDTWLGGTRPHQTLQQYPTEVEIPFSVWSRSVYRAYTFHNSDSLVHSIKINDLSTYHLKVLKREFAAMGTNKSPEMINAPIKQAVDTAESRRIQKKAKIAVMNTIRNMGCHFCFHNMTGNRRLRRGWKLWCRLSGLLELFFPPCALSTGRGGAGGKGLRLSGSGKSFFTGSSMDISKSASLAAGLFTAITN